MPIFSASWDFAVSRTIGVRTPARRSSRQTSKPSFFGSITSSTIRSHPLSRPRCPASWPSPRHFHLVLPSSRRIIGQQHLAISASSSTTGIRAISSFLQRRGR